MHRTLVLVSLLGLSQLAHASEGEVRTVAEAYLNALTGAGDERGREQLLGGATMNAQLFLLENWRVVAKDPVQKEEGDLAKAVQTMRELDRTGRGALNQMMEGQPGGDELTMHEVTQEDAARLLAPTKDKAERFSKDFPVLAYVARVGKEVYWHPKNPLRVVLAKARASGRYQLELHHWTIETTEGPRKTARRWPLRILRFKAGKLDTGWKVLPASDWNAE